MQLGSDMLTNSCNVQVTTTRRRKEEVHPDPALDHLVSRLSPPGVFGLKEFLLSVRILRLPIVTAE